MTSEPANRAKSMSVSVRISGALREYVEWTTAQGDYESVAEYVRDLIRQDEAAPEQAAFELIKAELQAAFAAPRSDFEETSADDIRALAANRISK